MSFLLCGLCSAVVDESMTIEDLEGSRSFLARILHVEGGDIPERVCADCFREISEYKEFADRSGQPETNWITLLKVDTVQFPHSNSYVRF